MRQILSSCSSNANSKQKVSQLTYLVYVRNFGHKTVGVA